MEPLSRRDHLHRLADLLATHRPLLSTHPNDCDLSVIPESWTFSSEELAAYYTTGTGIDLPPDLKRLIDEIRTLQLPRTPLCIPHEVPLPTKKGMSPKKLHEVQRMATYVKDLVDGVFEKFRPRGRLHIVDVGAGQGYLTRALGYLFPDARLLALDADHGQTMGAEKRAQDRKDRKVDAVTDGLNKRIHHRTVLITPSSLLDSVDAWVKEGENREEPVPVLFVALHACGSLTPDMLRAFLSSLKTQHVDGRAWYPLSIVTVGCCYNLMYPEDYPLSLTLRSYPAASSSPLSTSSFHLAAQIPLTWLQRNPQTHQLNISPSVKLATQKIVWRALLQFALAHPRLIKTTPSPTPHASDNRTPESKEKLSSDVPVKWWTQPQRGASDPCANSSTALDKHSAEPANPVSFDRLINAKVDTLSTQRLEGLGQTETAMRLGKLPDSTYNQGWAHFIQTAAERLGVSWDLNDLEQLREPDSERRIEVLHTLRCFLGSAVESAILLDRHQWIREELENASNFVSEWGLPDTEASWDVALVNLFEQQSGSGRNVALAIAPILPLYGESISA